MNIKVISLQGCSATPPTVALVREVAAEMGLSIALEQVIVQNEQEAQTHRHIGSPTVQINGLDIEQEARGEAHFGIT